MTRLEGNFRRAVFAYVERSSLSAQDFGQLVLGDPGFIPRLGRGQPVYLDTADRLLRFIGETQIGPVFRREVEAYLFVFRGRRINALLEVAGNPSFVTGLRAGSSPPLSTVERVRACMRSTANETQRAAIARFIADGGEQEPVLSPDPAAFGALVDDPNSPTFAVENRPRIQKAFFTPREAADFLTLSPRTLDGYRSTGAGPVFHKFGSQIRYSLTDLKEWVTTRRLQESARGG